ncbi:MAG: HD-GYP domain-containing protein [Proteobacteria bacterium]|nr:HD-GYP domain-containing protein [Pseudomonadota bacterium]
MIKKVRVDDLEVGMFVDDFNVPWLDHPFLTNKKKLKSAKEIDLLRQHGVEEVYIDTRKGKDSPRSVPQAEADAVAEEELARVPSEELEPPPGDSTPFEQELRKAREVYTEAKVVVQDLLQDARLGRSVDGERAATVVDKMVDSIFRNRDALASLSRLKNFDDYTFQHSLNVSVLALTLGRHLGIVKGELRRLGIGAVLHDVGKMRVPEQILNKPGRLTDDEFAVMKGHPLHGAKILMETPQVPDECSAVALNHHERFNGRGYPRGLQGLNIGKFGLISAIVDVYDAITSDRVYHKGMPSHQAVQKIYEWGKTDFYPIYVQKFIQCLGIYPIGSVVQLDTGEVGVVCRQNHDQLLRPRVRLVRGPASQPLRRFADVDLTEADPREEKPFFRTVVATLEPAEAGVNVGSVLLPEEQVAA